jgi:hypothetical protein
MLLQNVGHYQTNQLNLWCQNPKVHQTLPLSWATWFHSTPPPPANFPKILQDLMMEAVRTSEVLVYSETTRCCIPEGSNLHTRGCENLKSFSSAGIWSTPSHHQTLNIISNSNTGSQLLFLEIWVHFLTCLCISIFCMCYQYTIS